MENTQEIVVITETGGRAAKLVPSEMAGSFRRVIVACDPWSALLDAGMIEHTEWLGADAHHTTWVKASWAADGRCGYEPAVTGSQADIADRVEMDAWRQFRAAQVAMPVRCRSVVYHAITSVAMPSDLALFRQGCRALAGKYGLAPHVGKRWVVDESVR